MTPAPSGPVCAGEFVRRLSEGNVDDRIRRRIAAIDVRSIVSWVEDPAAGGPALALRLDLSEPVRVVIEEMINGAFDGVIDRARLVRLLEGVDLSDLDDSTGVKE